MPGSAIRSKDVVINGRFLTQRLSGVQRYAREIVTALDGLIANDPDGLGTRKWHLAVPPGATVDLPLQAIRTMPIGRRTGHGWEQVDLARAARGARLVNLGNSGPVLHRDSIVVIHDAAPYRTPENFGRSYALLHRMMGRVLSRTARLATVSEFSRGELSQVLRIPAFRITVVNNGCDHLMGRAKSPDVLKRLGLGQGRYFLFVGNPTPNKNLPIALEAFRHLDRKDVRFVVAGALDKSVFGGDGPAAMPGLIVAPGLPDEDIAGLYAGAAAHLFPSRYEGFGIPPLEAMICGCPVIAADIPVVREVCGDAAAYFTPGDVAELTMLMARHLDDPEAARSRSAAAGARVAHFTWNRAARSLAEAAITP